MPRPSVWLIRASLICLAVGFTFGAGMLANEGLAVGIRLESLRPAHVEILLMGWVMQLALGVAYWILPRFTRGLPRGNATAAWLSMILLNAGILLVVLQPIFHDPWFALLGRVLEAAGILAFLLVSWRRLRPSATPAAR